MDLKLRLKRGEIRFLIDELTFDGLMSEDPEWLTKTSNEHMRVKLPFVQTDMLCEEMVNLTPIYNAGKVKLKEPRRGLKDRAVALAYGNHIATLLENKLNKEKNEIDYDVSQWQLWGNERGR